MYDYTLIYPESKAPRAVTALYVEKVEKAIAVKAEPAGYSNGCVYDGEELNTLAGTTEFDGRYNARNEGTRGTAYANATISQVELWIRTIGHFMSGTKAEKTKAKEAIRDAFLQHLDNVLEAEQAAGETFRKIRDAQLA